MAEEIGYTVNKGGLLRCCIATLDRIQGRGSDGVVVPCDHCSSSMILDNGVWRWNREAETNG